jgi:hypothetical protein
MEKEKIIFWRNFFFRTFITGLLLAILLFVVTVAFWDTWLGWVSTLFPVDEKEFGSFVLNFFGNARVVLVFMILCPAIAFHWLSKDPK